MKQCMDSDNLHRRLKKIVGQVQAIDRMVDEGSDIAVDASDIALIDDEVKELPHLFAISKHMMSKIKFNLSFSMTLNFVAIVLAMTGILNPVVGALVHNAGSVFVIINSAFLLSYKRKM